MRRVLTQMMLVGLVLTCNLGAAPGHSTTEKDTPSSAAVKAPETGTTPYQVGISSWYGEDFQGKPTATGEPYDMNGLTAAHMKLPLGTWVKVTNLRNGRSVILRINDRGPVIPGRILDVSAEAAYVLGFRGSGLGKVRIDVLRPAPEREQLASARSPKREINNH